MNNIIPITPDFTRFASTLAGRALVKLASGLKVAFAARFIFIVALSLLYCSPRADSYYKVGVIDRDGQVVIPCRFGSIEWLGNGMFFAEEINGLSPERRSFKGLVFDQNGKAIPLKIPKGCTLSRVYLRMTDYGKLSENELPAGAILQVRGHNGFGLCNVSGDVLLVPKYPYIGDEHDGVYRVLEQYPEFPWTKALFLFDLNSRKMIPVQEILSERTLKNSGAAVATSSSSSSSEPARSQFGLVTNLKEAPDQPSRCELIDADGHVVQPPICGYYAPVSKDRIIKGIRWRHFDLAAWKDSSTDFAFGYDRTSQFAYFLRDYDLIGMSQIRVRNFLGKPDWPSSNKRFVYTLGSSGCGESWRGVEIEFQKKKVRRWRTIRFSGDSINPWVTANLVFNPARESGRSSSPSVPLFIPKTDDNQ